jgi:hypothetical protein
MWKKNVSGKRFLEYNGGTVYFCSKGWSGKIKTAKPMFPIRRKQARFIFNIIGVPVAAGILFLVPGVLWSPVFASPAMTFSSGSVIMKALRLRNLKL